MVGKKVWVFISFVILLSVLSLGFVNAITLSYSPSSGTDKTGSSTYIMLPSDLSKVASSDDIRYRTKGSWDQSSYGSEYVEWVFDPELDLKADIEEVKLKFEWQREWDVADLAKLQIWDDSASTWVDILLQNPTPYTDILETYDLSSYIRTSEEVNNLKIRFQARDINIQHTSHDLVILEVQYFLDETEPTCSIDYLENKDTLNKYYFTSLIYINEEGKFYVYGDSSDSESKIANVQYNRTSPDNFYFVWTDADPTDGLFNELNEEWRSKPNDPDDFTNGWHEICCRAADSSGNVQNPGNCEEFCIDTQKPGTPGKPTHSDNDICDLADENLYDNDENLYFSWDTVNDEGCAGVDYYEVILYDEEGNTLYTHNVNHPSHSTTFSGVQIQNGNKYYVKVRAWDKSGNPSEWSQSSELVLVDENLPTITLTPDKSDAEDNWYKDNFNVQVDFNDALSGLCKCEYVIYDNQIESRSGSFDCFCNENWIDSVTISVGVEGDCSTIGENTCLLRTTAEDKAGNINSAEEYFNIDYDPPETTKTVGEPKYPGPSILWPLIEFFVKPETTITLTCNDNGGIDDGSCNAIQYKLTYPNGTTSEEMEYSDPFTLSAGDGIYTIEYWSNDSLGNEETHNVEVDKVDTQAPTTAKDVGEPKYEQWVNCSTPFTLTCSDTEVGCDLTYYQIDDNNPLSGIAPVIFNLDGEKEGMHNIAYWSLDKLLNPEKQNDETDWLDCTPPSILPLNPTQEEASSVEKCVQSVVAIVNDDGSGIKQVWAELWEAGEGGEKVRDVEMTKTLYGTYEALIDKQLPAGDYILKIKAKDNVENINEVDIPETLTSGVFVEYIEDPICKINPSIGGECDFKFHVCIRDSDSVKMWMDKLGDVVTPAMMDAEISKGGPPAYVGLWADEIDAGLLCLGELTNGRTSFDLHLNVPSDVASMIGVGAHTLKYKIESGIGSECSLPID